MSKQTDLKKNVSPTKVAHSYKSSYKLAYMTSISHSMKDPFPSKPHQNRADLSEENEVIVLFSFTVDWGSSSRAEM